MPFASVYAEAVDLIDGSTKQPWRKHKPGRWSFEMMCFFHKMWWEIGRGKCNNQPLLTSIRLVIETMGGGGNVTINRVEGRRKRRRHNNYFEPQANEGNKVTLSQEFVHSQ
jgi:hypothetical protein